MTTKTLVMPRAQQVSSVDPVDGVIISITGELPERSNSLGEHEAFYKEESRKLAQELRSNLPGGLLHHLLAELLLQHGGKYLRVPAVRLEDE